MNDYFQKEFLDIEREILMLKTSVQRSASVIVTTSQVIDVQIPLRLVEVGSGIYYARGSAAYQVSSANENLILPTLDFYNEDVSKNWEPWGSVRKIYLENEFLDDGRIIIRININGSRFDYDGKVTDVERLQRGESVIVDVKLTVRSTGEFTIGNYQE